MWVVHAEREVAEGGFNWTKKDGRRTSPSADGHARLRTLAATGGLQAYLVKRHSCAELC